LTIANNGVFLSLNYTFIECRETFDFGMFVFTVGTAGLRNFSVVKPSTELIF